MNYNHLSSPCSELTNKLDIYFLFLTSNFSFIDQTFQYLKVNEADFFYVKVRKMKTVMHKRGKILNPKNG